MAKEKDQNRAERVSGEGSRWLNPQRPQTGNGRTKRDIYDRPGSVERDANGKRR
jgi:hypothetical protein